MDELPTLPAGEPVATVRAMLGPNDLVRVLASRASLEVEGQIGLDPNARHPAALDLLLAGLAADLLAGLAREARRDGLTLDGTEASLVATLDNPLVALGVVGERGSPALAAIRGSIYVSADAGPDALERLWRRTQARSPVYSTLARAAALDIALQPVT